jgi:hypothetical protein
LYWVFRDVLNYSDQELLAYRPGIRFAYALCVTIAAAGLVLPSIPLLAFAGVVAWAGTFPPYHPFDYLYNYGVRLVFNKPKIPPRTNQSRFACGVAAAWLAATIYLFSIQLYALAYSFGIVLLTVGTLVATTDMCIPSMIYNALFRRKN